MITKHIIVTAAIATVVSFSGIALAEDSTSYGTRPNMSASEMRPDTEGLWHELGKNKPSAMRAQGGRFTYEETRKGSRYSCPRWGAPAGYKVVRRTTRMESKMHTETEPWVEKWCVTTQEHVWVGQ